MKRGNFLKSLLGLAVAPAMLANINTKPNTVSTNSFDLDKIRMDFKDGVDKYRVGDIIVSDLGSKACITFVHYYDKYFIARPCIMGEYKCNSLFDFRVVAHSIPKH